jgi:hypothetical protein
MYLQRATILNSGALKKVTLTPGFDANSRPKPLVVVGSNGVGKTELLSTIADAIIEVATTHYDDIMPMSGAGRLFYRIVGARNLRVDSSFGFTRLEFGTGEQKQVVCTRAGAAPPPDVLNDPEFADIRQTLADEGNIKTVVGNPGKVKEIFEAGVYAFFPSNRSEIPHWLNADTLEQEVQSTFTAQFDKSLKKPIVVERSISDLKSWLVDVLLDASVDLGLVLANVGWTPETFRQNLLSKIGPNLVVYAAVNSILEAILNDPGVRIVRLGRQNRDRKIAVAKGEQLLLPSIDNLSAGQSTLLSIFGTLVRYADSRPRPLHEIEGVAVVDEIDAHVHADLQYERLPQLIRLFPKVQFIVSAHSPLFVLGMDRAFGRDGYNLIELPSGRHIDAERFSEFQESWNYYKSTMAFEAEVARLARTAARPTVICEGELDQTYFRAAAKVLGFDALLASVDFDWIGTASSGGARDGGKDSLASALKLFKNNPNLLGQKTVLLFDCDVTKSPEDHFGKLFIRVVPDNPTNVECTKGIENLLPPTVFEERFYRVDRRVGTDQIITRKLQKRALCDHLCQTGTASTFEAFRPVLKMIDELLLSP